MHFIPLSCLFFIIYSRFLSSQQFNCQSITNLLTSILNTIINSILMPLAHYYDVDRELHELKHRGELVPTRDEIMGKIGVSMFLSYSGLFVSCVTREGLGFVRVLHSRVAVSSCSYIREIAKIPVGLLFYEKITIVSCNRAKLVLSSASDQIILNMFKTFIQVVVCS